MNWYAFAIAAWIALGLELGLKDALNLGTTGIAPSFVVPLAVFICMGAAPARAIASCLILGLFLDLTSTLPLDPRATLAGVAPGPHALGLALAGQLVVTIRGMMIRRNPLTMAFLAGAASGVMHVVVVALVLLRRIIGDPVTWDPLEQLALRAGTSVYTGVVALPLALALFPMAPLLGLQLGHARYSPRRDR